ncbi:MAG: phage holin family protein, partial [Oscillospiraceae bacterium]|nr:phage holin family protein [Oscillospiraceae bacterium]
TALPSDGGLIAPVVVLWYIFTELGSIVENAAELGAPVPGFLRKAVASIRNAAEGKGEQ